MYRRLGATVSRFPIFTIGAWIAIAFLTIYSAPKSPGIWQEGEFAFLPEDAINSQAQQLFREAFPSTDGQRFSKRDSVGPVVQRDPLGSNIVVVLFRENRPEGLSKDDFEFLRSHLIPQIEVIRGSTPLGYELEEGMTFSEIPESDQVIHSIETPDDKRIGALLKSPDERAALVFLQLGTEFLDRQNGLVVDRMEELLSSSELLRDKPVGLAMALSGSATVGRDILRAEAESAERTETFTKFLVIVLLLLIYRAPLLALVPLITVGISVEFTLSLLTHLANAGVIGLFNGLAVYVTVVSYGAGVDYCLFIIARYKEELDLGHSYSESIQHSIRKVGAALATSAGTSIVGIGMMAFAEFGKFRQAGIAISIGLFVAVCFAVTFTPALLLILRNWAFWPDVRKETPQGSDGWLPASSLWQRFREQRALDELWNWIAHSLKKTPGRIFLLTVAAMVPFGIIGFTYQGDLSYGLLTDLPQDDTSVVGANAIQEHFPAGVAGPAIVLIKFATDDLKEEFEGEDLTDLRTAEKLCEQMTEEIESSLQEFNNNDFRVVDIRNQFYPLGQSEKAQEYLNSFRIPRERVAIRNFRFRTYTSAHSDSPVAGQVMRMDFVFSTDPFERITIAKLADIERIVKESIPKSLRDSAHVLTLGPTAGIRDLKHSTDRDRVKIDILVVIAVYLMLVALLRTPAVCGYLIVSVCFSFLVALGMTYVVFYYRDPTHFTGIDWKVPIYLFTILIAMGEDYNILLMARVAEEQKHHGPIDGVLVALTKTGSIISSCGIIMAGTFASLMSGSLLGMVQLGFALAFGVLLDTFVVRPILVPAYLILLHSGRLGRWGHYLGAASDVDQQESDHTQE